MYGSIMEVFADVVAPLTLTMAQALESNGHGELWCQIFAALVGNRNHWHR